MRATLLGGSTFVVFNVNGVGHVISATNRMSAQNLTHLTKPDHTLPT